MQFDWLPGARIFGQSCWCSLGKECSDRLKILRTVVAAGFPVPDLHTRDFASRDFAIARIPGGGKLRRMYLFLFNALHDLTLPQRQGLGGAVVAGR